jgi:hypothetical protein
MLSYIPNYYLNQNVILYLMRMETTVVYLNFTDVNLGLNVANIPLPISTAPRYVSSVLSIHTSLSTIQRGFAPGFVNYKRWGTRLAAASDKVYQLLTHGLWFSLGTPASSTTKTGRHMI